MSIWPILKNIWILTSGKVFFNPVYWIMYFNPVLSLANECLLFMWHWNIHTPSDIASASWEFVDYLYTRVIGVLVFGVDKGYTLLEHALGLSKNGWIFWWFLFLHIFSQWCSVCINIWRLSVHDMAYWKTVYWKFFLWSML